MFSVLLLRVLAREVWFFLEFLPRPLLCRVAVAVEKTVAASVRPVALAEDLMIGVINLVDSRRFLPALGRVQLAEGVEDLTPS